MTSYLFFGGVAGGLYAANVGGGALIAFPLLLLTGLPTPMAIATQRFAAILLEGFAALRFYTKKEFTPRRIAGGLFFGGVASVGALWGSHIVLTIQQSTLNKLAGTILIIVATLILFQKNIDVPHRKVKHIHLAFASLFIGLLGIYGGFFGAGFGTFVMFVLLLTGFSFRQSAPVSRLTGLILSITSSFIFAQSGSIDYGRGIALGLGFALGAWIGIDIALKQGTRYIKAVLIAVVFLTALKLFS